MIPPAVPPHLPELTQVEEMLIARVHVTVQVYQVRGHQYKYRGHVVHFVQNVVRTYGTLPLLPEELQIIILRPPNSDSDPQLRRQFRHDFRVRRAVVQQWLDFLVRNHPACHDVVVRRDALESLPEDDVVIDHLPCIETLEEGEAPDRGPQPEPHRPLDEEPSDPEVVGVPDLHTGVDQYDQLRELIQPRAESSGNTQPTHLTAPTPRITPINEFDESMPLISSAFPSLFPFGRPDYVHQRLRAVDKFDFIRHLMRHESGIFARHPRFRYVMFNMYMRRKALRTAGFYVSRQNGPPPTLDELRAAFLQSTDEPEAARIVSSIIPYAKDMTGTRPFWGSKRAQLNAMINQVGCAHIFLTLSAADLHWADLMRYLPYFEQWEQGNDRQRHELAWAAIRDCPHIVAYWFYRRFQLFLKHVLTPLFGATDHWARYEWQGRGSMHTHMMLWLANAPDPENLLNEELREYFATVWGFHIVARKPCPDMPPPMDGEMPPMQAADDQIENTAEFLSKLVRRVQTHKCNAYCIRKKKGTDTLMCRFRFPFDLQERPQLKKPEGSSFWRLYPQRDATDQNINQYDATCLLGWLANIDIAPCTGAEALMQYLSKYCSKAEKASISYQSMLETIISRLPDESRNPQLSAVCKFLNSLIAERDWSAQEVSFLLEGGPLVSCSRTVRYVDCRPYSPTARFVLNKDTGALAEARSILQKYEQRADDLSDMSYLNFLLRVDEKTRKERAENVPDYVLHFSKIYDPTTDSDDFARVKLMLHHPFTNLNQLKQVNGREFASYTAAWEYCKAHHNTHMVDYYGKPPEAAPEQLFEDIESDAEEDDIQPSWAELAGRAGRYGDQMIEVEDPDRLGERLIDREHDWTGEVNR